MKPCKWLMALMLVFLLPMASACAQDAFLVTEAEGNDAWIEEDDPAPEQTDAQKEAAYRLALEQLEAGALVDAINGMSRLGHYRSAVSYTAYAQACLAYERQDVITAAEGFAALGDFADAPFRIELCEAMAVHRTYRNGQFGYVDLNGSVCVEPVYDWAERVFRDESRGEATALLPVAAVFEGTVKITAEDIAPVQGKYGLLRRDGVLIVPMAYDEVLWALEGVAAMREGARAVLLDLSSGARIGGEYDEVGTPAQGSVTVRVGNKWGHLSLNDGELLGQGLSWDAALPFSEGLAGVTLDGQAGFISLNGSVEIPLAYQNVRSFGEGRAAFRQNRRWGFISISGQTVIEPTFADAGVFSQGACPVKRGEKWGLIDESGEWILTAKYDEILPFDGMYHRAWIRMNRLWGLAAPDGTLVLAPAWGSYTPFGAEGMALVSYRGGYGYIDTVGVTRIPNRYAAAAPFACGRGGVAAGAGKVEYLDRYSRGFVLDSDVPTPTMCGFIEGRQIISTEPDAEGNVQRMIAYRLYGVDGSPVTNWTR